jgi:hypothetical protein
MPSPKIETLENVQYNLMLRLRMSAVIPAPPLSPLAFMMWMATALPSVCVSLVKHFCHKTVGLFDVLFIHLLFRICGFHISITIQYFLYV